MGPPQLLSRDAYDRLLAEFRDLTTRGRIDIARKIEAARELGDLSENGDYHAAKEEQGRMEGRILHLTRTLDEAGIVDDEALEKGVVGAGSIVSVLHDGDDSPERYLIGSIEEKRFDVTVVSPGSPLGTALAGAVAGDEVEYESPAGHLRVNVIAVE